MMEEPLQSPKRNGPPTSWIPLLTVVREGGGGRKVLLLSHSAVTEGTEQRYHTLLEASLGVSHMETIQENGRMTRGKGSRQLEKEAHG